MKKKSINENESIINSLFTDKELEELEFTPEEIEIIETAELVSQLSDSIPDSDEKLDKFFDKFEKTFPPSEDMVETMKRFMSLSESDPEFFSQIIAYNTLIDTVEEVPEATAEKVSLADIKKEKNIQIDAERKAKFARIDAMLEQLAKNKGKK